VESISISRQDYVLSLCLNIVYKHVSCNDLFMYKSSDPLDTVAYFTFNTLINA
jgi:hypothetical protein